MIGVSCFVQTGAAHHHIQLWNVHHTVNIDNIINLCFRYPELEDKLSGKHTGINRYQQSGRTETPALIQFENHQVSRTRYGSPQCKNIMKHGIWENATSPQHSPQGNSKILYKSCWVGTSPLQSNTHRIQFHPWYKTQSKYTSPIPAIFYADSTIS